MKSGVLRKKEKITVTKAEINIHLFFQRINCNPTKFEVGINKENTEKGEDDEWNVDFFQIERIEQNARVSNIVKVTC